MRRPIDEDSKARGLDSSGEAGGAGGGGGGGGGKGGKGGKKRKNSLMQVRPSHPLTSSSCLDYLIKTQKFMGGMSPFHHLEKVKNLIKTG